MASSSREKADFKVVKDYYRANGKAIQKLTKEILNEVEEKSNLKSETLRKLGNELYQEHKFKESICVLTESLCHAIYNGKEYGLALASRSAVLFSLEDYENCIKDLELCLKTEYPSILKPKIYIRLTKCYSQIGRHDEMQDILKTCIQFMKTLTDRKVVDGYNKNIQEMVKNWTVKQVTATTKNDYSSIPALDENPSYANAAKSVQFNYNSTLGPHVVATQDINCGDILFIEKPYVAVVDRDIKPLSNCCFKIVRSCVPCKECIQMVYCNENCRDDDWNKYHKWECKLYKTKHYTKGISYEMKLVLRTLLKAGDLAFLNNKIDYINSPNPYNDKNEAYKYICNFPTDVVKLKATEPLILNEFIENSLIMVQYLKVHTDVFNRVPKVSNNNKTNNQQLFVEAGSLILRLLMCTLNKTFQIMRAEKCEGLYEEGYLGEGFYPFAAQLPHSCVPNTHSFFVDDTVVVKAIKQIKSGDIVYRSVVHCPYNEYTKDVTAQLGISCQCGICTGTDFDKRTYERMICMQCGGSGEIEDDHILSMFCCEDCGETVPVPLIRRMRLLYMTTPEFLDIGGDDIIAVRGIYRAFSLLFKPFHSVYKKVFIRMFNICSKKGLDIDFLEIMSDANKYYKVDAGDFSFAYGSYLIFLCSTILAIITNNESISSQNIRKLISEAKLHMVTAKEIMKVFYPPLLEDLDELDHILQLICFKNILIIAQE